MVSMKLRALVALGLLVTILTFFIIGLSDLHQVGTGDGDGDGDGGDGYTHASGDGDGSHGDGDGNGDGDGDGAHGDGDGGDGHTDGDGTDGADGDGSSKRIRKMNVGTDGDGDGDAHGDGDGDGDAGHGDGDGDGDAGHGDGDGDAGDGHSYGDGSDGKGDGDAAIDAALGIPVHCKHSPRNWRVKGGRIGGSGCKKGDNCAKHQPYWRFLGKALNNNGMLVFDWQGSQEPILILILVWFLVLVLTMLVFLVAPAGSLSFLSKRVFPPHGPTKWYTITLHGIMDLSCGMMLFVFWLVVMSILVFCHLHEHGVTNNLVSPGGRGLGAVVALLCAFMLYPVTKNSIVLKVFGLPFEKALSIHRGMGMAMYVLMTIHGIIMGAGHAEAFKRNGCGAGRGFAYIFQWKVGYPHGPPLAGFLAWVFLTLMIITAMLRRSSYMMFLAMHMLYALVLIFGCIHYPNLVLLLILPVLLYFIDIVAHSFTKRGGTAEVKRVQFDDKSGITSVEMTKPEFVTQPGQYVMIQLKDNNPIENWHPFSVATAEAGKIRLFCKSTRHGSWTNKLPQKLTEGDSIYVKGPFGQLSIPLGTHNTSIMIAGGVGITPFINMIGHALAGNLNLPESKRELVLIWTVPNTSVVETFRQCFLEFSSNAYFTFTPIIYVTKVGGDDREKGTVEGFEYRTGRPQFDKILGSYGEEGKKAAYMCGPAPMIANASACCHTASIPFHQEVFEF